MVGSVEVGGVVTANVEYSHSAGIKDNTSYVWCDI